LTEDLTERLLQRPTTALGFMNVILLHSDHLHVFDHSCSHFRVAETCRRSLRNNITFVNSNFLALLMNFMHLIKAQNMEHIKQKTVLYSQLLAWFKAQFYKPWSSTLSTLATTLTPTYNRAFLYSKCFSQLTLIGQQAASDHVISSFISAVADTCLSSCISG